MAASLQLAPPQTIPNGGIAAMSGSALLFSAMPKDAGLKVLATGLRRRDPDLIDRLIEQHQYRLFRYLVYLTASRERAEDFFQETWIRVIERGSQYNGETRFETWLFSIARHLVIDWQRQRKPQSLDSLIEPESGAPVGGKPGTGNRGQGNRGQTGRFLLFCAPWRACLVL